MTVYGRRAVQSPTYRSVEIHLLTRGTRVAQERELLSCSVEFLEGRTNGCILVRKGAGLGKLDASPESAFGVRFFGLVAP